MITRKISAIGLLTGLLTACLGHGIALADTPGYHPYYLHARSDLRKAELMLETPDEYNVTQAAKIAAQKVHYAIEDIDVAGVLDAKDIYDYPQIDTSLNHRDKFQAIYKLLRSAESDLSREEDNSSVISWRNRAEMDINQAKHYTAIAAGKDTIDDLTYNNY
ncbi:hypothetical protein H6G76_33970 [Nostoc sp. FACHB-152]|uniref:hypothetical protein n=1 Tax=unclassified Nostoc TaxID=2593658 RepID=UPI0016841730|nr:MULTISPECIES: hypothetical protein [unclassified Nostoc]MBD2452034.1 hypothetical protein [Nostoc sp. FACHB-152]MBD2469857.1 hypothetical protein [Nostoc sp. FACHB-145]